jgi:CubicO group peptidase (beta-lactamase class C family)
MAYPRQYATAAVAATLIVAVLANWGAAAAPTQAAPGPTMPAPAPSRAAPAPTRAAPGPAMDAYLAGLDLGGHPFRGAVLVARGEDVLLAKGYGVADLSTGTANTPHTLYRIASVTKQFTALAMLKLQELGKLKVTDRVCQHIAPCPAAWEPVTVEHLLMHTSGIPSFTGFRDYPSFSTTTLSPEQLVGLFRDRPTQFPAGSQWKYSNSGYALLGYLIERLAGVSYADFLRRQILDPLGLSETGYDANHPTATAHAVGYMDPDDTPARFTDMSIPYAAGALYSSVSDLYRWNRFLLTGTPAIVDAATLTQMFTPRVLIDPAQSGSPWYGYGWVVSTPTTDVTYAHDGGIDGFTSYNLIKPRDQLSVTLLSNRDRVDLTDVAQHLATLAIGPEGCRLSICTAVSRTN